MPKSTYIAFVVIDTLEAIIIIVGNSYTIFVFWTQRSRPKRTYFLLISLAVADLLVGITELVVVGTTKSQDTEDGDEVFRQSQSNPSLVFKGLFSSASVFFLALISLERAFAVLWPIRHRVTNSRVYINSIVIVWAVGLFFFGMTLLSFHYPKVKREYVIVTINTFLLISLLIICISYLKIRNRLSAPSPGQGNHDNQLREHNLRLSRTLFIAIASSLVFYMPAFVVFVAREFCSRCFSAPVVWFVYVLQLANSMVNPLVYSFRMPIFKDSLKKFCRKRQQNIRPIQQDSMGFSLESSFSPTLRRLINISGNELISDAEFQV